MNRRSAVARAMAGWLLAVVVPPAAWWVRLAERRILRHGVPLAEPELADAARMGVRFPECIRLLRVDSIYLSNIPALRLLARPGRRHLTRTVAMSMRYGIFVRADWWGDRQLIAHECVHTAQYERLGGIAPFLRRYFGECLEHGYAAAPLEREAIEKSSGVDD